MNKWSKHVWCLDASVAYFSSSVEIHQFFELCQQSFFFCDSRWQLTIANSIIKFWGFSRKCKNKRLEILKFNWLWLMMLNIIWKIKFTMVKYEITYWFPGGMKKFSGFIFIFQHNWEFVAYSYFSDIPTISWTFY